MTYEFKIFIRTIKSKNEILVEKTEELEEAQKFQNQLLTLSEIISVRTEWGKKEKVKPV